MIKKIPDISKKIYKEEILNVLKIKYSTIGTIWVNHQMEWNNRIYSMFKDHDKALIIIYLTRKTLDFYGKNFIKLNYEEYFSKDFVEIEKFNVIELSNNLNIPKETARRKLMELEKVGIINKENKKTVIDRSKFSFIKPEDSVKRISYFLNIFSEILESEKILKNSLTSKQLQKIIMRDFTYIWKIYYDMQITMMLGYKKIFSDYETWHIFGTCIVNQHLHLKNENSTEMNRAEFIKTLFSNNRAIGVNAMSISDITSIPRATVVRKLKSLVKLKFLKIDNKKHYKVSGNLIRKIIPLQNIVLNHLANFSTTIYNSLIL